MKKILALSLILALFSTACVCTAGAENAYPRETVKLICPWAAGGSTDITARAIAEVASEKLGVPVIVENREGGGSSIGTQEVANIADGDGYTILVATINGIAVLPHTLELDYSPDNFKSVGQVCEKDLAIVAAADKGWTDFNSFVEDAKTHPGEYMIAVSNGSLQHITFQSICDAAGIEVGIYPVSGDSEQITAVLGKTADLCLPGSWNVAQGQIEAGEMVALGVLSAERLEEMADVATLTEQGYETVVTAWTTLLVPASVSDEIAAEVETAFAEVLQSEELAEMLIKNGQNPSYVCGEENIKTIEKQYEIFGAAIADMGL